MIDEINNLREELRQSIRMMEDAVITDNRELVYMLVGKIGHIQSMIDYYADFEKQQKKPDGVSYC